MLAIVASILTIALAIYSASPWNGDSPYDNLLGYVGLIFFTGFAVSPYAYLFFRSAPKTETALTQWLFVGIGIAITVLGIAIIYDATIISIDAQSGIVFFIIPIYQWIVLIATRWGFRAFLRRRN